jgi:hypothetical protein
MAKKMKWACHLKGHQPMDGVPADGSQAVFNGELYEGCICKFCGCVYYSHLGKASDILKPILVLPADGRSH